jgi:hypothetical protein
MDRIQQKRIQQQNLSNPSYKWYEPALIDIFTRAKDPGMAEEMMFRIRPIENCG